MKRTYQPDPKPGGKRIVKPATLKKAGLEGPTCVICGVRAGSVHHVVPRSQGGDDVLANLVSLCGSGTTGCHGNVEHRNGRARERLARYLRTHRPDTVQYVNGRMGAGWLKRQYG